LASVLALGSEGASAWVLGSGWESERALASELVSELVWASVSELE
jgi:hypothetical protein